MTTTTSSTGGTITFTATGLIHTENTNRLTDSIDAIAEHSTQKPVYDFSQFPTAMPVNTITGRVVKFN